MSRRRSPVASRLLISEFLCWSRRGRSSDGRSVARRIRLQCWWWPRKCVLCLLLGADSRLRGLPPPPFVIHFCKRHATLSSPLTLASIQEARLPPALASMNLGLLHDRCYWISIRDCLLALSDQLAHTVARWCWLELHAVSVMSDVDNLCFPSYAWQMSGLLQYLPQPLLLSSASLFMFS